jgi:pilus assembly protein CpaE
MATSSGEEVRLLVVEDVPQVAQYIRNLLASQTAVKLLDVASDGARALHQVEQLRPDIVIVDALLQGRMKGMALVTQLHAQHPNLPVIVLTVPQRPVPEVPSLGVHGVLSMPFSGFDLFGKIQSVRAASTQGSGAVGRLLCVFAPKGGVGKTTIAFNLAVAVGQLGVTTVLIDGSLQFGDLRGLLKVPADAPSILDLPTDRIQETDLQDVLWRDPSGIDILLAPPRIEQVEMVNARDIEKILSLLRRVYSLIVVDLPTALSDISLAFLDNADSIIQIVTYDSTTIRNTVAIADTFNAIGYPPEKVQYLLNRSDSAGGMSPGDLRHALGREPEHSVVSDGILVVQSNNEGLPFVLANPAAPVSRDIGLLAAAVLGRQPARSAGRR